MDGFSLFHVSLLITTRILIFWLNEGSDLMLLNVIVPMKMEQKGMTFDHDICYFLLLFFFPLFIGGKRKGEKKSWSKVMPS